MTETPDIISRLRAAADASGPTDALLVDACDLLNEAADHIEQQAAARRAFLERAVCHPGPPMSETEDYDPDADLSELEGSVLERMDMETRFHRELMEIRREAEGILVRTPDPSRSTVQVFKDLLAHFVAFHQHLEEQVASTKRAALGLIRERRVIADDRVARAINTVAMLRRRCERYEGWWALPPAQRHPLGPEFSDGVGSSRPDLAEIEQIITNAVAKRYPNGGHHEETLPLVERVRREIERGLAPTTMQRLGEECRDRRAAERQQQRDAVAEHIRAAGGNPEAATVAQIADALNATSEGATFTVNEAGDGVSWEIDQKARVTSIEVVGGDAVVELGLAPARPVPPMTGGLADRILGSAYEVVPPYTNKCTSMGTIYEEASEWAGAPPVLHDGKVDMPRLAAAWKHLESVTVKSPVEVRSRCPETGETRFARCPWTTEGAVDAVELPPGGNQADLCEAAIALYQQRGQTDQTPFVITGFIPALSPDPDLCWMRGPPEVMQRIIANPDEPAELRRWMWVGVGGVTFIRAKP